LERFLNRSNLVVTVPERVRFFNQSFQPARFFNESKVKLFLLKPSSAGVSKTIKEVDLR